mmetsp:Transcript_13596/g.20598  ORF Transcript_13596/g.20598 Transcript_13596/m.20598 type:complete len:233 (-) Transcript_13596:91-789(-)
MDSLFILDMGSSSVSTFFPPIFAIFINVSVLYVMVDGIFMCFILSCPSFGFIMSIIFIMSSKLFFANSSQSSCLHNVGCCTAISHFLFILLMFILSFICMYPNIFAIISVVNMVYFFLIIFLLLLFLVRHSSSSSSIIIIVFSSSSFLFLLFLFSLLIFSSSLSSLSSSILFCVSFFCCCCFFSSIIVIVGFLFLFIFFSFVFFFFFFFCSFIYSCFLLCFFFIFFLFFSLI